MDLPKKKLLVDLDDTVCQSFVLRKVNSFLGTNYKIEDFTDYVVDNIIPVSRREEFFKSFYDIDPYEGLPLIKGAKEGLKKLSKKYDIYICSSCVMLNSPETSSRLFSSKFDYLLKELPFLDPKKFIFTSAKDVICGDIIIDDYFHNLRANIPVKLLFDTYHNRELSDDALKERGAIRVKNWKEICDILLKD